MIAGGTGMGCREGRGGREREPGVAWEAGESMGGIWDMTSVWGR